ncbi:CBS domain-containing protein [Candidatus Woesearchaeota archaeon]|nr:CBS domain-containing protein [Candidatus Woesearchaeota archaeon]
MKPEQDYRVADFMTRDVLKVTLETTAKNCAEVMAAEHVSSALVTENNALLGIVTEKDLSRKIVAKGLDPNKIRVKDIMATDVVTVGPEVSLYDAMLKLNKKKIKHLPVVNDGVIVGIITTMEILRLQPSYMELLASPTNRES